MMLYNTSEVQVPPQFPGDIKKYLADSIRYPDDARKKNIQGFVILNFIVEKSGSVSTITVMRSPDTSLSIEAKRVVSTMKWIPGKKNGVPVRVHELQSVIFRLR